MANAKNFELRNDKVKVVVGKGGELVELVNLTTGHNYASGGYLWRMYYDTHDEQEIEIIGGEQSPKVKCDGKSISLEYDKLSVRGEKVDMALRLTITLEGEDVRFASEVQNGVEHTVIRELQYPLVRNAQIPADHNLITAFEGGRFYENPTKAIISKSNRIPYTTPASRQEE